MEHVCYGNICYTNNICYNRQHMLQTGNICYKIDEKMRCNICYKPATFITPATFVTICGNICYNFQREFRPQRPPENHLTATFVTTLEPYAATKIVPNQHRKSTFSMNHWGPTTSKRGLVLLRSSINFTTTLVNKNIAVGELRVSHMRNSSPNGLNCSNGKCISIVQ